MKNGVLYQVFAWSQNGILIEESRPQTDDGEVPSEFRFPVTIISPGSAGTTLKILLPAKSLKYAFELTDTPAKIQAFIEKELVRLEKEAQGKLWTPDMGGAGPGGN